MDLPPHLLLWVIPNSFFFNFAEFLNIHKTNIQKKKKKKDFKPQKITTTQVVEEKMWKDIYQLYKI